MPNLEKTDIELGYIPLLDCIAILWAQHRGFFQAQGLNVKLCKEVSWASLRDRLAFGSLDAAHCLSAMLPAAHTGHDQLGIPFKTSLVLSQNCANISLSQKLCYELGIPENGDNALEKLIHALKNHKNIQLAHVFPYSIHHYCLREWLAKVDAELAKNLKLATCPPPYMIEAISNHMIDGFCVSEPWNIQGEILGLSQMVESGLNIIPDVVDKVLAFTTEWAEQHPTTLSALTQAIHQAQSELSLMDDFSAVWQLLNDYNIIQFPCSESVHPHQYYKIQNIIKNFVKDNSQPKIKDFIWLSEQMLKWHDIEHLEMSIEQLAQSCIHQI